MNTKNQSASLLIWIISGLYLLAMVWFLLSPGGYGAQEAQPWLVPAVVLFTVSYGILMLLLWPHEKASLKAGQSGSFDDHPDNSQGYHLP